MTRVTHLDDADAPLLELCRNGDEAAFDELVRRHQQRALNVAYQVVRDREDAMEVAQDAFVNVYKNIGSFRGECLFTTWLHSIVVNLARNRHRWWKRRGRSATVSLDEEFQSEDGPVAQQVAATTDSPAAEAVNAEYVVALDAAMEKLPATLREVMALRNVQELSYEEIAVALDCSVGTVKSRLARARGRLRELMNET